MKNARMGDRHRATDPLLRMVQKTVQPATGRGGYAVAFPTAPSQKTDPLTLKKSNRLWRLMDKLRVLVVDDTTLLRQGVKSLLERWENIETVFEAATGQEAVELAQELSPNVILLDQDMPGLDSVQTIRVIKERLPKAEVLVLAERPDEEKAFQTIEAGASGYVLKDINAEGLFGAIEGVCNGKTHMHSPIARQLVDKFRVLMRERKRPNSVNVRGLTSRELQILVEMTKGATDREIASRMDLGATTVKSHTRSIFRKLGARNRTQAVAYVLQNGTGRSVESSNSATTHVVVRSNHDEEGADD